MKLFLFACLAVGLAGLCSAYPLLIYSTTLAVFGVAHVVTELAYVNRAFSYRVPMGLWAICGSSLLLIIGLRLLPLMGLGSGFSLLWAELALVSTMVLAAAWYKQQQSSLLWILAIGLCLGVVYSPAFTLVGLAVVHNLTPLGFLADGVSGSKRFKTMSLAYLGFIGIPLLIASGVVRLAWSFFLPVGPDITILPTGPLALHLGIYVPEIWRSASGAQDAFAAVTFAQCAHYFTVIGILPRLQNTTRKVAYARSWSSPVIWLFITLATGLLLWQFSVHFAYARSLYAIPAALHAYIELPLLLYVAKVGSRARVLFAKKRYS